MLENVKKTLISEIEDLQISLTHLLERVKDNRPLSRVKVIDANHINVLIGRYQEVLEKTND